MTRTALELIGQGGLGYSFDPLTEDGDKHIFSKSVKEFVYARMDVAIFFRIKFIFRPVAFKTLFIQMYLTPLVRLGTPKFRRFILNLIPWKALHQLRDISDVVHNTAVEIINSKKRALADGDEAVARQIGQGKDILSVLSKGFSFLDYG